MRKGTAMSLSIILIARLLTLRLHKVYRVFCAFLVLDLIASFHCFLEALIHDPRLDYRLTWIGLRVVAWILSLWMVYGLLHATLEGLPGILRFSRKLLNITFLSVMVLGLLTVRAGYGEFRKSFFRAGYVIRIGRAVKETFDLERVISTVALLVLVLILGFVLWFPVQMPRNLAVFSAGFVVYFAAKTSLLLTRGIWSRRAFRYVEHVDHVLPGRVLRVLD